MGVCFVQITTYWPTTGWTS